MADLTTGELQAVSVGDLPVAPDIYDDTLIPVEQSGEAKHMTGAQWKAYGVAAAKEEADRAAEAALHTPIIQNGTWWLWNFETDQYVDSGVSAQGPSGGIGPIGPPGPQGANGEDGSSVYVLDTYSDANYTYVVLAETDSSARTTIQIPNGTDGETPNITSFAVIGDYTTVKFSTGQTIRIPNGADGADGKDGATVVSLERTSGTGAAGTTDTYTITMSDGNTFTFTVYNGADGQGSGDMLKSIYDPQNKNTDVFLYVDNARNDLQLLISELTTRLNALANSEDVDLDQLAELVAYIKDNRSLIEQITTNKVNVSDIIDNLTTNVSNKPLSAAQGVALKSLIDAVSSAASAAQSTADTAKTNAATAQSRADAAYSLAEGKQSKITGTAGQFVVIGTDGNPTVITLTNVSEVGA